MRIGSVTGRPPRVPIGPAAAPRRGAPVAPANIAAVLRDCERAIYGRSEDLPGADAVSTALAETEALLRARTR
jgi:hypothetical protein